MSPNPESTQERRTALIESASAVFLRYGFKKTSMDDLARAAGISRQGLYLHFATKEALFGEVIRALLEKVRERSRAAFAEDGRSTEQRLFAAFESMMGDEHASEHIRELLETATELAGESLDELEKGVISDLTRVLKTSGVAASWDKHGISAKALAEHLHACSWGLKHRQLPRAEYLERMRTAVKIICRGSKK